MYVCVQTGLSDLHHHHYHRETDFAAVTLFQGRDTMCTYFGFDDW